MERGNHNDSGGHDCNDHAANSCRGHNDYKYCLYDGLNKMENVFDNAHNFIIITVKGYDTDFSVII